MNLMDMFNAAFESEFRIVEPKVRHNTTAHKPWMVRQERVTEKYRNVLTGNKMTTSEIAGAVGTSHMGALQYLYTLEERGKVRRVGVAKRDPGIRYGQPPIIWAWNEEE